MTPPPGSAGGLLNPIIGSLIMTVIAVAIGTPIGMLAGTYMAEYGRYDKLAIVVRFINDILLSAPSIVIGLFIYEIMVAPMGHFSGWAGAVALAVIVIPVVVRTTEDMLTLVPDTLREAAAALGLPRAHDDQPGRLSRRARRHDHRRAAGGGAHIRRDRAAAVHRAQQPVLSTNLNAPMASLPVVIFQFALSPYKDWQKLAWSGALIITLAVLALSIIARLLRHEENVMNVASYSVPDRRRCADQHRTASSDKVTVRNSNFYYGDNRALKDINVLALRRQGDRLHRPLGLRQIDAAAHPQPHVRPVSGPARRGRGHARRRQHPRPGAGPQSAARQGRHGVPEADAVPDVDLREHRLRHPAVRKAAAAELDERVEQALRRAALWDEVKDKLGQRPRLSGGQQQRLCIARTVAVKPEVMLLDEPCSALDPISTAKIEELIDELKDDYTIVIVTHNMQQAARVSDFTAFMYLGELVEFGTTDKMFTTPNDRGPRTTSPAASADAHRVARARCRAQDDNNDRATHDQGVRQRPQDLARMVAEMGGLAEKQVADFGRRAGQARQRAGAAHHRRRQDRHPAARDRGKGGRSPSPAASRWRSTCAKSSVRCGWPTISSASATSPRTSPSGSIALDGEFPPPQADARRRAHDRSGARPD